MPENSSFKHFMLQEIYEQPEVVRTCLDHYLPFPSSFSLGNIDQIHILACGTSLNSSLIGQYLFEQIAGIPTRVRSSSEFLSAPFPLTPNTLTIAVTQSGETADTLAAVIQATQCLQAPSRLLAITNRFDSSISKQVDDTFYTYAGEEKSVAATKTFLTQLAVFYSLAFAFAHQRQQCTSHQMENWLTQLHQLPICIQQALQQDAAIAETAKTLKDAQSVIVLGSGINYPIAREGALKLKEATYTHAEGYAAGEFLHGPIALLDENIPVIAIVSEGEAAHRVLKAAEKAKTIGSQVIYLDPPNAPHPISPTLELLSPFLTIIPLQLLAYHLAIVRGIEVDRPRNITKSLTGL